MRYDCKERNFTEEYLTGGDAIVAYNPEAADKVYLQLEGDFIEFCLIESRFADKSFKEIKEIQLIQKNIIDDAVQNNLQGRVDLASHVERIVESKEKNRDVNVKGVGETKKRAKEQRHKDFIEEVHDGKSDDKDA